MSELKYVIKKDSVILFKGDEQMTLPMNEVGELFRSLERHFETEKTQRGVDEYIKELLDDEEITAEVASDPTFRADLTDKLMDQMHYQEEYWEDHFGGDSIKDNLKQAFEQLSIDDYGEIEELEVEGVDFRCVFTYIGEGYNGNYDINDPEDEPLYRLDVYELDEEGEEFRDEPSYSSCTTFSVREDPQTLMNYLETILEKLNENKEDIRNRKFSVEYVVNQTYNDIFKAEIEQGEER